MKKGIAIIQTWGTNSQTKYLNKDTGHASIELRLPATEENYNLIMNYCAPTPHIPCDMETEKNKDGTEQEIYIVRFSFIPNELNVIEPFRLNSTYNADALYTGNIHPDPFFTTCTLTEKGQRAVDNNTVESQYIQNLKAIADYKDLIDATVEITHKTNNLLQRAPLLHRVYPSYKKILNAIERLDQELGGNKISAEPLNSLPDRLSSIVSTLSGSIGHLKFSNDQLKRNHPNNFETFDEHEYLFYGRPCDKQIKLSIGSEENELNAACMLEQMRKIVDTASDSHMPHGANTILSILNAGNKGKTLEFSFSKNFQTDATPQMVYTTAIKLKNKSRAEDSAEIIQEKTRAHSQSSSQQKLLIVGLLATAGLVIGAGIGVTLVATGVFAPLGVGLLGLVMVAGTMGGGLALISGSLGLSIMKSDAPSAIATPTSHNIDVSVSLSYSFATNTLREQGAKADNSQKHANTQVLTPMPSTTPSITSDMMSQPNLFFHHRNSSPNNQEDLSLETDNDHIRSSV